MTALVPAFLPVFLPAFLPVFLPVFLPAVIPPRLCAAPRFVVALAAPGLAAAGTVRAGRFCTAICRR